MRRNSQLPRGSQKMKNRSYLRNERVCREYGSTYTKKKKRQPRDPEKTSIPSRSLDLNLFEPKKKNNRSVCKKVKKEEVSSPSRPQISANSEAR